MTRGRGLNSELYVACWSMTQLQKYKAVSTYYQYNLKRQHSTVYWKRMFCEVSMMVVVRDHHTYFRMMVTDHDHHGHSLHDGRGP